MPPPSAGPIAASPAGAIATLPSCSRAKKRSLLGRDQQSAAKLKHLERLPGVGALGRSERDLAALLACDEQSVPGPDQHAGPEGLHLEHAPGIGIAGGLDRELAALCGPQEPSVLLGVNQELAAGPIADCVHDPGRCIAGEREGELAVPLRAP